MRDLLICLFVLAASGGLAQEQAPGAVTNFGFENDEPGLKVMSFNIRYGLADDGENSWEHRKDLVAAAIAGFDPDLLGTQECLEFQAEFLRQKMPSHGFVGVGRDDGKLGGEMCGIFFREDRFELLDSGHFWLSPEPGKVGSVGWDAALTRMASWVKLQTRDEPPFTFIFCNTHFDHIGAEARRESARVIDQQLDIIAVDTPVILAGDFNAPADLDSAGPYPVLVGQGKWQDTLADPPPLEGTFNGFQGEKTGARIDWILTRGPWEVLSAGIDHFNREGRYPSDHFPVTAILR